MRVVYDLEQFPNFHSCYAIDVDNKKEYYFVISEFKDQSKSYLEFIKNCSVMVGFNNLHYDYYLIDYLLKNEEEIYLLHSNQLNEKLFDLSQKIINNEIEKIPEKNHLIRQIDLFKIWHLDNKARRSSLKDIQVSLNWKKVEDLPLPYDHIVTRKDLFLIEEYNRNDVLSTYEFLLVTLGLTDNPLYKGKNKLKLRNDLKEKYNIDFTNSNDPKIGSDIILELYCKKTGKSKKEVLELKTLRDKISIKECILPYIRFETKEFKKVIAIFNNMVLTEEKKKFKFSTISGGLKFDYGIGGIHGANPGIYESNDEYVIKTCDVASLYPSIAIENEFYPEHLGKEFCEIYRGIREDRFKAKKNNENAVVEGLKLALNGTYGKSSDKYSYLFDRKFTLQITVNGQLLLSMLAEKLILNGFKIIMINTDGLECIIPKEKEQLYFDICKEWESLTKLTLEFDEYQKLFIRDVNNYIGIYKNNKIKLKGEYEIDKELYKDNSQRIVPIAVSNYFINNIKPEETILNHLNTQEYIIGNQKIRSYGIYDFCKREKLKKEYRGEIRKLTKEGMKIYPLSKTTRYYISNDGYMLFKIMPPLEKNKIDDVNKSKKLNPNQINMFDFIEDEYKIDGIEREERITAGYLCTIFNNYEEKENYDLNYKYYIKESYKLINSIINN
ncbi:MAG: hypothetical protein QXL18_05485 [Candidatus Woesearchaeota archaeon]